MQTRRQIFEGKENVRLIIYLIRSDCQKLPFLGRLQPKPLHKDACFAPRQLPDLCTTLVPPTPSRATCILVLVACETYSTLWYHEIQAGQSQILQLKRHFFGADWIMPFCKDIENVHQRTAPRAVNKPSTPPANGNIARTMFRRLQVLSMALASGIPTVSFSSRTAIHSLLLMLLMKIQVYGIIVTVMPAATAYPRYSWP